MRSIVSRENMRFVEIAGRIWINSPIKAEQPHHLFGAEMAILSRCPLHLEEDLVYDVGFLGSCRARQKEDEQAPVHLTFKATSERPS